MDTARHELAATRHQLLDRVSRVYIDLFARASAQSDNPRFVERVFERGWDLLVHGSRWDESPVSAEARQAVSDLMERAQYVDDEEGLTSWLDTLPGAAAGYLEPAGYDLRLSAEFPGVQTSFVAMAAGGFFAPVAESSRYRVEFASGDGQKLDRDPDVAERELVAA